MLNPQTRVCGLTGLWVSWARGDLISHESKQCRTSNYERAAIAHDSSVAWPDLGLSGALPGLWGPTMLSEPPPVEFEGRCLKASRLVGLRDLIFRE